MMRSVDVENEKNYNSVDLDRTAFILFYKIISREAYIIPIRGFGLRPPT